MQTFHKVPLQSKDIFQVLVHCKMPQMLMLQDVTLGRDLNVMLLILTSPSP